MYPEIPVIELSKLGVDLEHPFHRGALKDVYSALHPDTQEPSIVKIFRERQFVGRDHEINVSLEARSLQAIESAEDYILFGQNNYLGGLTVPFFHLVEVEGAIIGTHIGAFRSIILEDLYGQKPLLPYELSDFYSRLDLAYVHDGIQLDQNSYHPTQLLFDIQRPYPRADQTRIRFGDCVVIRRCRLSAKNQRMTRVKYDHSITKALEYISENFVNYNWRAF